MPSGEKAYAVNENPGVRLEACKSGDDVVVQLKDLLAGRVALELQGGLLLNSEHNASLPDNSNLQSTTPELQTGPSPKNSQFSP